VTPNTSCAADTPKSLAVTRWAITNVLCETDGK